MAKAGIHFYDDNVKRQVLAHVGRNLNAAAIYVQTAARRNVRPGGPSGFKTSRGSGGLLGSIGREVNTRTLRASVGSNLRYARIQELGGMITPKDAKHLAVPISDEAKKSRGPRFMSDLVYIPRTGKSALLARTGAGAGLEVHWVLVDQVILPPRPYLRPALLGNRSRVTQILTRPMPKGGK